MTQEAKPWYEISGSFYSPFTFCGTSHNNSSLACDHINDPVIIISGEFVKTSNIFNFPPTRNRSAWKTNTDTSCQPKLISQRNEMLIWWHLPCTVCFNVHTTNSAITRSSRVAANSESLPSLSPVCESGITWKKSSVTQEMLCLKFSGVCAEKQYNWVVRLSNKEKTSTD